MAKLICFKCGKSIPDECLCIAEQKQKFDKIKKKIIESIDQCEDMSKLNMTLLQIAKLLGLISYENS